MILIAREFRELFVWEDDIQPGSFSRKAHVPMEGSVLSGRLYQLHSDSHPPILDELRQVQISNGFSFTGSLHAITMILAQGHWAPILD